MAYKEFSYYYDYFNYNADYDKLFIKVKQLAEKIRCFHRNYVRFRMRNR